MEQGTSIMKGIVIDCLRNIVMETFGVAKWRDILQASGQDPEIQFGIDDDLDDRIVLGMFGKTCEETGLSFEQACDIFGAYWVGTYIPRRYPEFYVGISSTKAFLLKLDDIHATVAARMTNARPPRHGYEWKNRTTLMMDYRSHRDLMRLFVGAVHGAARHFKETVTVRQIDGCHIEIEFPA
jgi:hypothetical protein